METLDQKNYELPKLDNFNNSSKLATYQTLENKIENVKMNIQHLHQNLTDKELNRNFIQFMDLSSVKASSYELKHFNTQKKYRRKSIM